VTPTLPQIPNQPLFILTCMRSYSSLVSSMLGQHPALYALPEVNPFIDTRLGTAIDLLQMVRKRTLDGLYRAVAELEYGAQTEQGLARARRFLAERRDWSPTDLMGWFAARAAPAMLVEKSPSTVLQPDRIACAIALFPEARFLHLYRHPVATTASIAKITGHGKGFGPGARASGRDPELLWLRINSAILDAAPRIAPGRFMAIRGEDLLTDPDRYLAQICEWLDIPATPADLAAMRHPEASPYARVGPESAPFGNDPAFLRNPVYAPRAIEMPALDTPLDWTEGGRRPAPATVALALQLGYPEAATTLYPVKETTPP
jgi:hypothetical protein